MNMAPTNIQPGDLKMSEQNACIQVPGPDVCGHLASNWLEFNRPALIISPQARPGDLLAWCWAEVKSLNESANTYLGLAPDDMTPNEFSAIFSHRLQPLEAVLEHAVNLLSNEARHINHTVP